LRILKIDRPQTESSARLSESFHLPLKKCFPDCANAVRDLCGHLESPGVCSSKNSIKRIDPAVRKRHRGAKFCYYFSYILCTYQFCFSAILKKSKKGFAGIRTQVSRIRTLSDNQLHYKAMHFELAFLSILRTIKLD
jgi:hypothetical protein